MRYIIGIDLGTTNSSVFYADSTHAKLTVQPFHLPQLTTLGTVQTKHSLPSFCYLADNNEIEREAFKLPWHKGTPPNWCIGTLALQLGAKTPTRLVSSAKSWLCQPNIGGKDQLLPFEAASNDIRISPLEASIRYLSHIRASWNHVMAKNDIEKEFDQQDVVITVPASFDEVARTLTAEAAQIAGIKHFTLLEEPQAAFYSWIASNTDTWHQLLPSGTVILVCDVGGGTTDFSLIKVEEKDGKKYFSRTAVGDHLLLGGDNIDNMIAYHVENLFNIKLNPLQWLQLCHQARIAKEFLLQDDQQQPDIYRINLQGTGSNVIGGSISTNINVDSMKNELLNGFFPILDWSSAKSMDKRKGLHAMGLAYEEEPAISKHLAAFLSQTEYNNLVAMPDYVLFNGGTMKPKLFRDAILHSLQRWFPQKQVQELTSHNLDLAVARGAAYYGLVKRGFGIRIAGGSPRSFYLGININEMQEKALTLLPKGADEGFSFEASHILHAKANTPISFKLFSSHTRLSDQCGDIVDINPEELHCLAPLQTILVVGKKSVSQREEKPLPVKISIKLTEIGTIELWLHSLTTDHRWKLQFQVRSSSGNENYTNTTRMSPQKDLSFAEGDLIDAENEINKAFRSSTPQLCDKLIENLETVLNMNRRDWPPSILRKLWQPLLDNISHKKCSATHEKRWWNLAGFLLRPGCGIPLDEYRIKDLWRIYLGENKNHQLDIQLQLLICFRRISCGLSKGQQTQIANEIIPLLIDPKKGRLAVIQPKDRYAYEERLRTLASFESLDISIKSKIGHLLIEKLKKTPLSSVELWALGRLGARHLMYASAAYVIPRNTTEAWIEAILKHQNTIDEACALTLSMLACLTKQRELNVNAELMTRLISLAENNEHMEKIKPFLTDVNYRATDKEQSQFFGESLPTGLTLITE